MLQELDKQLRDYEKRKRIAEEELEKHEPTTEQVIKAVLSAVDVEEQGDTPIPSTPEELHSQAGSLLATKGKLTARPRGSLSVILPGDRDYLKLPPVKVGVGGRQVRVDLQEPSHLDPNSRTDMQYSLGLGLDLGGEYMYINEAIAIGKSGVKVYSETLDTPDDIRRVSAILTKANNALPPKSQ